MPKYCYYCKACFAQMEIVHSMTEKVTYCSECQTEDSLERIPQITNIVRKNNVGNLVEEAIKENRDILKQQVKERLKNNNEY